MTLGLYRQCLPPAESQALEAWASTFYPFQRNWLFDDSDFAISNKSRQIGMSHTTSAVGVLWGAFRGELTTIISIGDRESAEVLDKAKKHAEVLQTLGSTMAQTVLVKANEIRFASGGRILALPSTGGRGFSGNVFLDEFAYQQDPEKVWDSAAAVTMLGGRIRVASTPNGVGNEFHNLWTTAQKKGSGWNCYEIPIGLAKSQGFDVDLAKCWTIAKGDQRVFDQLFNCSFLDNDSQYVPTALIRSCALDDELAPDGWPAHGDYYAGLDIGKSVDLTVLVVVWRRPDGTRVLRHIAEIKRTDSDALEKLVSDAFRDFKLRRLCVDATGMGAFPAERLRKKHGLRKVEPIHFTLKSKEELATQLYTAFQDKTVKLPLSDTPLSSVAPGTAAKLRQDIASIRREITSAGNVRYDAPHTSTGHADRAWALMLALHASGRVTPRGHVPSDIASAIM